MKPLVSVVLPAFNGVALIAEAVESVRKQGFDALEIVVVDDGSTDSTAKVVRGMGPDVRYTYQERGGPASARNRGISLALGSLIAFIDQDDLWPAEHLSILMEMLAANPSAGVAMGMTRALVLTDRSSGRAVFTPQGLPWRAPQVGSALFRKEVFDLVGSLDDRLRYCSDDLDWFMRAREQGVPIAETDAVTLLFRIHETNTSRDKLFRRNALIEALYASVRRRRESNHG